MSGSWVAIQHVPFEGPGLIAEVAARRGIELQPCHTYRGESLPSREEVGGLVVMGGPMGVGDTDEHPSLARERELIAETVRAGLPVLGVCLGAQLMAHSLGARVHRGAQAEIGLGTVALTEAGREDPVLGSAGLELLPVMHWHQDTFELPDGASLLARSEPRRRACVRPAISPRGKPRARCDVARSSARRRNASRFVRRADRRHRAYGPGGLLRPRRRVNGDRRGVAPTRDGPLGV